MNTLISSGIIAHNSKKNDLEKIQLEAGRIVTGTTKLVGIELLYIELGWLKLSERRRLHKLNIFYKMDHNLSPAYLSNLLPPHVGDMSGYPLRNAENYASVNINTSLYGNSFLPSTIREWNKLPVDLRNAESITSFKRQLDNDHSKIPSYFYYGNRLSQILHTRLRTECSSLNYYLNRRNLVPSPLCVCGVVENNHHFLLICPRYSAIRDDMINTVIRYSNVTLDVLLFGNETLSIEDNENIFKAVHTYIIKTKRFISHG